MKALVTGGTGFIGSHLVDHLLTEGYDVRVLKRPESPMDYLTGKHLEAMDGDLLDPASLQKACQDVEAVFHVAAYASDWGSRQKFLATNLQGTQNLLDACLHKKISSIVFMSSAAVYGFTATSAPITEDAPKHPTPKYGESKDRAERLLWQFGKDHDIRVSAVRSALVTGPRDRITAPFLIPALQHRRLFTIGDGQQTLSISDGRDVAACLFLAAETHKSNGQAYNVKSFDCTVRQLIDTASAALHIPPPAKHRSYAYAYTLACLAETMSLFSRREPLLTRHKVKVLGHTRILDTHKAEQDLGYRPRFGCTHTITDTVALR